MREGAEMFFPVQFPNHRLPEYSRTLKAVDQVCAYQDAIIKNHQTIRAFRKVVIGEYRYMVPLAHGIAEMDEGQTKEGADMVRDCAWMGGVFSRHVQSRSPTLITGISP